MIKLTLIGNLGRDAEIRDVSGKHVIAFTVAHNESYTDKQGVKQTRGVWVQCNYWRDPGQTAVAQYLNQGQKVYVEGTPSVRAYTAKDGQQAASLELRVISLELLGGNERGEQRQPVAPPRAQPQQAFTAGPIPEGMRRGLNGELETDDALPFNRIIIQPDQKPD